MQAETIAGKTKIVVNAQGKPTEVTFFPIASIKISNASKCAMRYINRRILKQPYEKRSKDETKGKTKRFTGATETLTWLNEKFLNGRLTLEEQQIL